MSDNAIFRINQDGVNGTYGRARQDIGLFSAKGAVTCEAENKAEASYLWELLSLPVGASSVTINNSTTHTCNFNLVQRGGYLIRLTTNGGAEEQDVRILYIGIALAHSALCIPAKNETNEDNSQTPYDASWGFGQKTNEFLEYIDTNLFGLEEITNFLIVDGGRTDSYTENGSRPRPYKTIQAALDAMSGGETIIIFPATYSEVLTPTDTYDIVMKGFDPQTTIVTSASTTLNFGNQNANITVEGLTLTTTSGALAPALYIGPVGSPDKVFVRNCIFNAETAGRAITLAAVNSGRFEHCIVNSGHVLLQSSSTMVDFYDCEINGTGANPALHNSTGGPMKFIGGRITSTDKGIHIQNATNVEIRGTKIVSSGEDAMVLDTTASAEIDEVILSSGGGQKDLNIGAGCTLNLGLALYDKTKVTFTGTINYLYPVSRIANDSDFYGTTLMETLNLLTLPKKVLLVDGERSGDSYTETGSLGQPYRTIQAAVTAASAGTLVLVKPSTYAENITVPDVEMSIVGWDKQTTIISPYPGVAFTRNGGTKDLTIKNFTLYHSANNNTSQVYLISDGGQFRCENVIFDHTDNPHANAGSIRLSSCTKKAILKDLEAINCAFIGENTQFDLDGYIVYIPGANKSAFLLKNLAVAQSPCVLRNIFIKADSTSVSPIKTSGTVATAFYEFYGLEIECGHHCFEFDDDPTVRVFGAYIKCGRDGVNIEKDTTRSPVLTLKSVIIEATENGIFVDRAASGSPDHAAVITLDGVAITSGGAFKDIDVDATYGASTVVNVQTASYDEAKVVMGGTLNKVYFTKAEHIDSSAGAGDVGKPIKLDAGGHVDATMVNDADVDHNTTGSKDGGGGGEFYHLTLAQHTDLTDGNDCASHKHDDIYFTETEHIDSSAGAGDSGKPIKLDAGGNVDATMINDADVNHNTTGSKDGGGGNEYYHLTSAQHTDLTDGNDCSAHKHDDIYFTETEHIDSSAGAGDSGKPIKLDADGHVDATMINNNDLVQVIESKTINHDDSSPVLIFTAADGDLVVGIRTKVIETFDGDTTVDIGDAGNNSGFAATADMDFGSTGYKFVNHDDWGAYLWDGGGTHQITKAYSGSTAVNAYITTSTGTQGQLIVYLEVIRLGNL